MKYAATARLRICSLNSLNEEAQKMKKLWALTRASLSGVLFANNRTSKKKIGMILLYAFLGVYFAGFSGLITAGLYYSLSEMSLQTLIPVLFFIGASILTLMNAIFSGSGFLYQPKDLHMLLSLPVSHATVMISKFLSMYLYSFTIAAMFTLPSGIVYLALDGGGVLSYIGLLVVTLFLPLLPLAIGCILSYFVGLFTRKLKHKNVFSIAIGIIALAALMMLSQNGEQILLYLQANGVSMYDALMKWYFPAAIAAESIGGNVLYMLLFIVINVAPFAIIFPITSKKYASIVAGYNQTAKAEKYVYSSSERGTKFAACFKKELSRVTSSANYFMNSCSGMLLMLVLGIMFLTNNEFALLSDGSPEMIANIVTMLAIFACTMTSTTTCAISIEGKSLWIYKTAPVDTLTIFNAKLAVNILLNTPITVIFIIVTAVTSHFGVLDALFAVLLPVVCVIYASIIGLIIDLAKPKLNWTNEIQVIKQSGNVLLMMLEGVGFTILMALALILPVAVFGAPFALAAAICTVIMCAVCAILYNTLKNWGARKFNQL